MILKVFGVGSRKFSVFGLFILIVSFATHASSSVMYFICLYNCFLTLIKFL